MNAASYQVSYRTRCDQACSPLTTRTVREHWLSRSRCVRYSTETAAVNRVKGKLTVGQHSNATNLDHSLDKLLSAYETAGDNLRQSDRMSTRRLLERGWISS